MKKMLYLLCAIGLLSHLQAQEEQPLINVAALQSGSYMVQTPPSYTRTDLMAGSIRNYTPEALFDLSDKQWCSLKNAKFPFVFVIELTESCLISKLNFNNKNGEYKGVSPRDVKVEFSNTGPESGYKVVKEATLNEGVDNTFEIEEQEGRWIRLTILNNYGNKSYTELTEFEVYGKYKYPDIKPINIDGRWQTNWGWVDFKQSTASVTGKYYYNSGKIYYGGINRNQVTYKWVEKVINREGWTLLFMNSEGNRLTGIWCYEQDWDNYGFWIMERKNGQAIEPLMADVQEEEPAQEEAAVDKAVVEQMAKELEGTGKVTLYGINFKTASAEITGDSYSVLNQVVELLKGNDKISIRIEGHTDNVGSDSYNEKLSNERAASVKTYIASKGVDEKRMTTIGKGESKPIADNATELGKAANRRVEIHKE